MTAAPPSRDDLPPRPDHAPDSAFENQPGTHREHPGIARRGFVAGGLSLAALLATAGPSYAETPYAPMSAPQHTGRAGRNRRPNVLVIVADDLGWADLSCYGAPHIATPHLDRLAREGVRYTQAYSASSTCSPTRFGLQTGQYPGRFVGGLSEPIAAVNEREGLPPGYPTIASLAKSVGYRTVLFGKWHLGHLPWFSPLKSGYDEWFGNFGGGLDYFSKFNTRGQYDLYENDVEYQDLRYYSDILTERTVGFLQEDHSAPWFTCLNYTTPHWPWEGPGDRAVSDALTARAKAGEPGAFFHQDGGSLATYVEMVQDMDTQIGRVLAALRRTGQDRNTIVLFTSDNGGERFSYQWPLTGQKWDLHEGGIRVPTILRWPERIKGRQVSHLPVVSQDWTRTLTAIMGASPHPDHPMDGRDLSDHLLGSGKEPGGDLFWRVIDEGALRRDRWKYWYRRDPGTGEVTEEALYDLDQDQGEKANVAMAHAAIFLDMRATHRAIAATLLPYPPGAKRFVKPKVPVPRG